MTDPVGAGPLRRTPGEGPRPELVAFTAVMEQKLSENDHKAHWLDAADVGYFLKRMYQEVRELEDAMVAGESPEAVLRECADVANMVMMVGQRYAHDRGVEIPR